MRNLCLLLLFVLLTLGASSQVSTITGTVKDTSDNTKLQHAVVSLISKTDSVLVSFTRVNEKGSFSIKDVPNGKYLLMVSFPKFADFVDEISVDQPVKDIGQVILTPKSLLLEEVIVRQRIAAIRMKGDTLEFRADSFAVREGANVEELLKKLPGIQVNKDGQITAQGERVQKVLVDGEEFFSDDPAVVTQNLRADAVENVQVFDKKSDQATFTGIDDGEKTKTINLKLKADKKQGYFGKAKIGGGIPGWFENEAMLNFFKGKMKFAAFGTMANTGKAGLNWEDNDRFGGGSNMEYNEEEGYWYSYSESDEFNTWGGRYNGEGMPQAWTGGAHFSNKWSEDRKHLNSNYRFYKQNINVEGSTVSQYILPDTTYFNNEERNTFNQNERHSLNGFYDVKLDSSSSLKISVNGTRTFGRSNSHYLGESLDDDSMLVNTNERLLTSDGLKNDFNTSLIYRKKFAKKGRTMSVSMDQQYKDHNTDGALKSDIFFFDGNGSPTSSIQYDQKKINENNSLSFNSRVSYTEPIGKQSFIEMNYGYRVNNSEALRISFNKTLGPDGKYDQVDSSFSNDYQFRFNTHSAGLNFRNNGKKLTYSFGSNVSIADFTQTDNWADTSYRYSFVNLFPKASIRYNFKQQTRLSINYNGNTRQPSLQQIQPIQDNTNTMNIQLGNPLLKQEFSHNVSMQFNDFKVLSGRSLWMSANMNLVDNAISYSSIIDKGVRTTQYINVSGNYNLNFWAGYWIQVKKYNLNIGFNGGGSIGKNNNYINNEKNVNNNSNVNISTNINYNKEKGLSFYLNPQMNFVTSKSSINPENVTRYWIFQHEMSINYPLPWNFEINTEVDWNIRQKTKQFNRDLNAVKWNAYLAKKFWKNKNGELRFTVFDILDQNIGFNRIANSNFISENTYNTIRRYWMVSFTWNFNKNPTATATK